MEPRRVRCVINLPDGPSRRVGPGGLLIGRKQDCDIVCAEASISRRHALVRLTGEGAEVVPLGRAPIEVNRKKHDKPTPLADGDRIAIGNLVLEVQVAAQRPDAASPASWRLERARGGSFGISHSPFVIGGADHDDLIVKRWPAQALRFHLAQGELYLEPAAAGVTRNGAVVEPGGMERLFPGDAIAFRKEAFAIRQAAHDATTAIAAIASLPARIAIEMLPRGGRVIVSTPEGERAVFLADRRLDLVIALLRPPAGYQPGDFIPDDVVRAIVWPRNPGVSRPEINVLIGRCRRDLVDVGLAGPRLIERAPGGGATRFALAPGAVVSVDS